MRKEPNFTVQIILLIKYFFKKIIINIHVIIIKGFINLVQSMVYGPNVGLVVKENGIAKDAQQDLIMVFY